MRTWQTLAERAGRELEDASAEDILRWAGGQFGDRLVVTSSMADGVLAHLAASVLPGVEVLFLDTGYHFVETLGTRDAVEGLYNVRVRTVRPRRSVDEQDVLEGPRLYERDPDRCCALRKVEPLERALAGYAAWATGIRRDEARSRARTPVVGWDATRGLVKVSPLARWTQNDVDAYVAQHAVLVNPLQQLGFTSIGCQPCTVPVQPGDDPRAGRWAGRAKTECGIHT
ncbi:MAG: phosphoadenylyl-sulfate reductase [Actinomycetes bacterium]